MRRILGVALVLGLVTLAAATAEDAPALDRVKAALATARHDLEIERARAEAVRGEAAAVTSAASSKRDAALARLDRARRARRELAAREAGARAELDRLATESEALENDLGPARELCRRLAAELATRDAPGGAERSTRISALVHLADDPGSDLGALASATLALLRDDLDGVGRIAAVEAEVALEGRGRVKGRVLRLGPWAWFLGSDGTEAIEARRSGGATLFSVCSGEGIAAAFAALDRGDRTLELPVDATGDAAGSGSLLRRSAELLRQGGLAIVPLLALSIVSLVVLVERLVAGRRIRRSARAVVEAVATACRAGDLETARRCALEGGAVGRAILRGLEGARHRETMTAATDGVRAALLAELKARLWILGTVGASAPFVGLFGTVVGIVRAFEDIARSGAAGFNVVAGGIAEALVATAAGIVVAIFAVIAYNALQAWSARVAARVALDAETALEGRPEEASRGA
ncbi:MAG TPA: MotA/TolQ/ExbB proton channel family protein [Planctomycetota bacterium]|nr:MotA/TolQ/ExbB proton channel family protein [Planctomycetota bacterium]